MKKRDSIKVGIIVVLLLLVVGFATVTATLRFNGTATFKGNSDEFKKNLRFVADTDEAKHATIESSLGKTGNKKVSVTDNGQQLNFTTPEFDTVGETATISYYIENRGQYDAKIGKITCSVTSANQELADYIEITTPVTYENLVLAAGSETSPTQTETPATIVVKLSKTYAMEEVGSVAISCTLPASAQ